MSKVETACMHCMLLLSENIGRGGIELLFLPVVPYSVYLHLKSSNQKLKETREYILPKLNKETLTTEFNYLKPFHKPLPLTQKGFAQHFKQINKLTCMHFIY